MKVTGLRLYPVKSLGGLNVAEACVEQQGLAGDRRWCLVDGAGDVVTARECHALLRLTAEVITGHSIRVTDRADGASIVVNAPLDHDPMPISLSRLPYATPAEPEVGAWISDRVGHDVRLVWQQDPAARSVSDAHGGQPGDVFAMADAGPLLLTSKSSLARLDEWIAEGTYRSGPAGAASEDRSPTPTGPLDMVRFRPNVVVDSDEPFVEDTWRRLHIGPVAFRTTELCDRCVMTTIDPVTLAGGKEPIRTLARHRRWDGATRFGIRILPLTIGPLRLGDAVVPTP